MPILQLSLSLVVQLRLDFLSLLRILSPAGLISPLCHVTEQIFPSSSLLFPAGRTIEVTLSLLLDLLKDSTFHLICVFFVSLSLFRRVVARTHM